MPLITDIRMTRQRVSRLELWLDGAPALCIAPDTALRFHLKKGLELDADRVREIEQADEALKARQALARYTALSVRSERQARAALARRAFRPEAIESAITHGLERGWIDDRAVAYALIRQRAASRPAGPARLRAELMAKGITPDLAEDALMALGPDEAAQKEAARRQSLKRLAVWRGRYDENELRRRLRDYLARQGYEPALAAEVAREVVGGQ